MDINLNTLIYDVYKTHKKLKTTNKEKKQQKKNMGNFFKTVGSFFLMASAYFFYNKINKVTYISEKLKDIEDKKSDKIFNDFIERHSSNQEDSATGDKKSLDKLKDELKQLKTKGIEEKVEELKNNGQFGIVDVNQFKNGIDNFLKWKIIPQKTKRELREHAYRMFFDKNKENMNESHLKEITDECPEVKKHVDEFIEKRLEKTLTKEFIQDIKMTGLQKDKIVHLSPFIQEKVARELITKYKVLENMEKSNLKFSKLFYVGTQFSKEAKEEFEKAIEKQEKVQEFFEQTEGFIKKVKTSAQSKEANFEELSTELKEEVIRLLIENADKMSEANLVTFKYWYEEKCGFSTKAKEKIEKTITKERAKKILSEEFINEIKTSGTLTKKEVRSGFDQATFLLKQEVIRQLVEEHDVIKNMEPKTLVEFKRWAYSFNLPEEIKKAITKKEAKWFLKENEKFTVKVKNNGRSDNNNFKKLSKEVKEEIVKQLIDNEITSKMDEDIKNSFRQWTNEILLGLRPKSK